MLRKFARWGCGFFGGFFGCWAFPLVAFELQFAKEMERLLELAREARAMEPEHGKGVDGRLRIRELRGAIGVGEEGGFEERDAAEAPGGVGEFLDQMSLGWRGRLVFVEETAAVLIKGGAIFGGQDGGTSGQAVPERVERRTLFAGFGAGSGGVLGVRAIDGRAVEGIC